MGGRAWAVTATGAALCMVLTLRFVVPRSNLPDWLVAGLLLVSVGASVVASVFALLRSRASPTARILLLCALAAMTLVLSVSFVMVFQSGEPTSAQLLAFAIGWMGIFVLGGLVLVIAATAYLSSRPRDSFGPHPES